MPDPMSPREAATDDMIALREELRQWKRALGYWSGLPAQEAFEVFTNRRINSARLQEVEDRIDAEYPTTPKDEKS